MTSPTRIDDELFGRAKIVAPLMSRSAAQQINHWARLGCELEASAAISQSAIVEVLAGRRGYDGLNPYEQAVVRAEWVERIETRRAALDLAVEFADAGRSHVELDALGQVVQRDGGAPAQPSG